MSKDTHWGQINHRRHIPDWARRERVSDMAWIVENLHIFWPVAQQQYQEHGQGAIVVDTTIRSIDGGHPFTYYTRGQVSEIGNNETQQMVEKYDPQNEMVIVLLKTQDRMSIYRVQIVQKPKIKSNGGINNVC